MNPRRSNRRWRRTLGQILPSWFATALFLTGLLISEALIFAAQRMGDKATLANTLNFQIGFVLLGAAAFALYRLSFHPAANITYGQWLVTTPWQYPRALPFGPAHLVWQDAIPLAVIAASQYRNPQFAVLTILTFVIVFALGSLITASSAGVTWLDTFFGIGIGGLAWLPFSYATGVAVVVALLATLHFGLAASLRRFNSHVKTRSGQTQKPGTTRGLIGWPFSNLQASKMNATLDRQLLTTLGIAAWWFSSAVHFSLRFPLILAEMYFGPPLEMETPLRNMISFAGIGLAMFISIARLFMFTRYHRPPISILGRVATGQAIIPGYDRVLLTPLLIVVFSVIANWSLWRLRVPVEIAAAVALLVPFLVSNWGLSFRSWQLTGQHRMVKPLFDLNPK